MSFLFGGAKPKTNAVKPEYTGLQIQTAAGTLPVPILMGRTKLAPNLIWADDFKAVAHTQKQKSGKGGGGNAALSTTYTYSTSLIMGLCEGPITQVTTVWAGQNASTLSGLGFTLYIGSGTQAPWGYVASAHPAAALAYPWTAYVAQANYELGSSNSLPNHNFEIWGLLSGTGSGGRGDADPVLCAHSLLTDPQYGALFPSDSIDAASWFSGPDAETSRDASWQTWCRAMGMDFSPCLNSQEAASSILERWFKLTNTAPVWSAGRLKAIPFADSPVSGNGYVFVPDVSPVYDLSDRDFVAEDNQDPVRIARIDPADVFNCYRLEFTDSANRYNLASVEAKDQGIIELYGLRVASTITAHEITTGAVARLVIELIKQRNVYIPLTFTFKLSWEYCLLEPMDLVTLSDPGLGLDRTPVRITVIEEDDQGLLTVTAENFPAGVATATAYPVQATSNVAVNTGLAPAAVNAPIIFEPSPALTNGIAQVWIAASGGTGGVFDPNWGGCDVHLSVDGVNYQMVGQITAPARMGVLTAALAPTGDTLAVNLAMSGGSLLSGTDADAVAGRTLCFCDGELLSFTTASLTGAHAYALTGLHRGQDGTMAGAHAVGAQFARLDAAVFQYDLPAAYIGQTIHVKLPSFNVFGAATQNLADCTAYTYAPSGVGYQIGAPGTMMTITPSARTQGDGTSLIALVLGWTASAGPLLGGYEVQWQIAGAGIWQGASTGASSTSYTVAPVPADTSYNARVRAISRNGQAISAWANAAPTNSGDLLDSVPLPPSGLTATPGANAVALTWAANAAGDGVRAYKIYRASGLDQVFASSSLVQTLNALGWTDSGLAPGSAWTYFLVAGNAAGDSAPAYGVNATVLANQNAFFASVSFGDRLANLPPDPVDGAFELFDIVMPVAVSFPAGLSTSFGGCEVAPAGSVSLALSTIHNGVATPVGSVDIAASATIASFALASPLIVPAGDRLRLVGPMPADATLAGLFATIVGSR